METGTIKFFDLQRGFGFITKDADKVDVFFHCTEIAGLKHKEEIVLGSNVQFELVNGPRGPLAKTISVLNGHAHSTVLTTPLYPPGSPAAPCLIDLTGMEADPEATQFFRQLLRSALMGLCVDWDGERPTPEALAKQALAAARATMAVSLNELPFMKAASVYQSSAEKIPR